MDDSTRHGVLERIRAAVATLQESGIVGAADPAFREAELAADLYGVFLHGNLRDECVPWRMPLPLWAEENSMWSVSESPHAAWCELLQAEMDIEEALDLRHVDVMVMHTLRRAVRMLETGFDRAGEWEERQ